MTANVGGVDRIVRVIAGLAIIGVGIYFKSWWGAVGALLLLSGLLRMCPAYLPFGITTAGRKA